MRAGVLGVSLLDVVVVEIPATVAAGTSSVAADDIGKSTVAGETFARQESTWPY